MFKASSQAGILMCGGDLISQTMVEKRKFNEVDLSRTLRFGLIGFGLIGPALFKWYGVLERRIHFRHPGATAFGKMVTDQLLFAPVALYGFFWANGKLSGLSNEEIKSNVRNSYFDVLIANYQLWPAVQMVNFWVIPLAHRILFVQTVALMWNTYLAWKLNTSSGGHDPTDTEALNVVDKSSVAS